MQKLLVYGDLSTFVYLPIFHYLKPLHLSDKIANDGAVVVGLASGSPVNPPVRPQGSFTGLYLAICPDLCIDSDGFPGSFHSGQPLYITIGKCNSDSTVTNRAGIDVPSTAAIASHPNFSSGSNISTMLQQAYYQLHSEATKVEEVKKDVRGSESYLMWQKRFHCLSDVCAAQLIFMCQWSIWKYWRLVTAI